MKYAKEPNNKGVEWLRSIVIPIKSFELYSDDTDLNSFGDSIKNVKVVALGEVTHGSSEIFKMKSKLIRYLVEKKRFNIFAIEANMPEADKLNEYVISGKGDAKKLIKGMIFWTWDTKEVLNLVDWMKDYNKTHDKKVIFTGFDMQYYKGALEEIKKLLNRYGTEKEGLSLINLENTLEKSNKSVKISVSYAKKEINRVKRNFLYLRKFGNKSIKNKKQKILFLQYLRIIEQSFYHNQNLGDDYYRDKCMAENLLWIMKTNKKDSKIIIWAHNGHIQKTDNTMGYYLSKKLKQNYLAAGFDINQGTYTARHWKTMKLAAYKLQPSYPGTYEYYFHLAGIPIFLLDFRRINFRIKGSQWLRKEHYFRGTGAVFLPSKEFFIEPLLKDFDMIIFIEKSSNSKLLHKH